MSIQILSWNVAGLRARLKNRCEHSHIGTTCYGRDLFTQLFCHYEKDCGYKYYDIVSLQETKCNEDQVKLQCEFKIRYPYRFWNSTKGTTQRKGLSGVTIWSKIKPMKILDIPDFDEEGRILALEFKEFILINVYVPNSQKLDCDRYYFREKWNMLFNNYIYNLTQNYSKEIVICGDFNVAHHDIDICNPKQKKNKLAGFFDIERRDFSYLLKNNNLIDVFREFNPDSQKSTYWSNFLKSERSNVNGWRIDYFLTTQKFQSYIKNIEILSNIKSIENLHNIIGDRLSFGSDHCPVILTIDF